VKRYVLIFFTRLSNTSKNVPSIPWNKEKGHDIIINAEAKPFASLCERRWSKCTTFSTSYLLLWQK